MPVSISKSLIHAFLLAGFAVSAQAAGIECPEIGKDAVVLSSSQTRLFTSGSDIDLANEISELIVSLKAKRPGISYAGLTNAAIAAYCPLVANAPSLSAQEKLNKIQKFVVLLREQLSSEIESQVSSILAQVPLSLEVYRALREKADDAGQTPSQFMAALLTKAAGDANAR
jgi:hypothetical protein